MKADPRSSKSNTAYLFVRPHVDTAGISALVTGCAIQTATCALKRWTPIIAVGTGHYPLEYGGGRRPVPCGHGADIDIRDGLCYPNGAVQHGAISRAGKATTSAETATTRCGSQGKARQREPAGDGC